MAQTGYTPISIYYSSTASAAPTAGNLVAGELAINTADGKLFYKDSAGVVQVIGTKGGVGSSTTTQVLYNSSGLVVGSANLTFNGTTLTVANDASISGLTVGKGAGSVASNTAVGASALALNTTGGHNNAFGVIALNGTTTGNYNNAFGWYALAANTTGSSNTAMGEQALTSNTTASNNTAVGYQAGYSNQTGAELAAFGYQALYTNTGNYNSAFGAYALYFNTSGASNTAVGNSSLYRNTTGTLNSALGNGSLVNNTTGASNVAIGNSALSANTTASTSVAVGYQAGYSQTTGGQNTLVGYQAGYANTSGPNTYIGYQSGNAMTSGYYNTILGSFSGNQGGLDIRTATNYIVLSDGAGNPRAYYDSANSGWNFKFGSNITWLTSNINGQADFGGSYAGTGGYDLVRFFNANGQVGAIRLSGSSTAYNTSSDYRLKENIAPMTGALAKVLALKPVTYKWKTDGSDGQGFIAHELAEIVSECVSGEKDAVDAEGKPVYQGIDTSFLVATLTAAIQELKAEVDSLKQQLGN